jgi:hypothetical protein
MQATVTVEMVSQYFVPSYISDNLCIPSTVIRYFMVLVYVIIMEYTISYRETDVVYSCLCFIDQIPNSCLMQLSIFIHHAYVFIH